MPPTPNSVRAESNNSYSDLKKSTGKHRKTPYIVMMVMMTMIITIIITTIIVIIIIIIIPLF